MPFLLSLAAGSLRLDTFRHYLAQDTHFLHAFERAYEMAEECADDDDDKATITALRKAILRELKQHASVLQIRHGGSPSSLPVDAPTPAPPITITSGCPLQRSRTGYLLQHRRTNFFHSYLEPALSAGPHQLHPEQSGVSQQAASPSSSGSLFSPKCAWPARGSAVQIGIFNKVKEQVRLPALQLLDQMPP